MQLVNQLRWWHLHFICIPAVKTNFISDIDIEEESQHRTRYRIDFKNGTVPSLITTKRSVSCDEERNRHRKKARFFILSGAVFRAALLLSERLEEVKLGLVSTVRYRCSCNITGWLTDRLSNAHGNDFRWNSNVNVCGYAKLNAWQWDNEAKI